MPISTMKIHMPSSFLREAEAIAFAIENKASVTCISEVEK